MSVFSLDIAHGNPVTVETVDALCSELNVNLKREEKEDYRRLLAVYHEASEQVMRMPDYIPRVDLDLYPRKDVHLPQRNDNAHGAWAWRCSIQIEGRQAHGILQGKKLAIKDNVSVKDVPMLLGTEFVKNYVPDTDATIVTRILEAGGHIIGKSVCENMCHSATSHSAATGSIQNPYAHGYSSGGSSSGSGVLVALGEADMAIGADQGGSIRVPATQCGIVGLKPTHGLVPYSGCASVDPAIDHAGPMTRSVLENAMLLQAIAGCDDIDDHSFPAPLPAHIPKYSHLLMSLPNPKSLTGLRIGVIAESLTVPSDARILAKFHIAASRFTSLGATVTSVSIPMHTSGSLIWGGATKVSGYLSATTAASVGRRSHNLLALNNLLHPMTQENWDNAFVSTKNIYLNGAYALKTFPGLLAKSTNLARRLRDEYNAALATHDILLTPTLPYLATSHPTPDATPLESIAKQVGVTVNTAPFNSSGHPALAMPIGMLEIEEGPLKGSGEKLPVGMQLVGRWWGEETIYRAAYAWEMDSDWRNM